MIVYILMMALSLLFCLLSIKDKKKKNKIIYAVLSSLPFIIVAGIRYDVGTDYMFRYVPDYYNILCGNTVENMEFLFLVLIKFCIFITHDYWLLFFLSALITYGLIVKTIYSESKDKIMSIFIFFISSMFFISLNLMRQYISIAIIYSTYHLLFKDKKLEWVLSIIIASLFHTVSLVFLFAYFLRKKKVNIYLYAAVILILVIFGKSIIELILYLLGNINIDNLRKYASYINTEGNFTWSYFLVELAVLAYFLVITYIKKMRKSNLDNFFINCQYLVVLFSVMNVFNEFFLRMSFVFSIFQLSSIPYFYYKSCRLKTKVYLNEKLKVILNPKIMIIVIIALFSIRLIYSNIINNSADVFPYKTIFERI